MRSDIWRKNRAVRDKTGLHAIVRFDLDQSTISLVERDGVRDLPPEVGLLEPLVQPLAQHAVRAAVGQPLGRYAAVGQQVPHREEECCSCFRLLQLVFLQRPAKFSAGIGSVGPVLFVELDMFCEMGLILNNDLMKGDHELLADSKKPGWEAVIE